MVWNLAGRGSMSAGFRGGTGLSKSERENLSELFPPSEFDDSLEAAFLLKQTGIALAAWTRTPVPQDVVSVMAATMWGSLDTMVRTLGGEAPRSAYVDLGDRRILVMQVEPNWTLLLVGPRTSGKRRLRREAQRILERVSRVRANATATGHMVHIHD